MNNQEYVDTLTTLLTQASRDLKPEEAPVRCIVDYYEYRDGRSFTAFKRPLKTRSEDLEVLVIPLLEPSK